LRLKVISGLTVMDVLAVLPVPDATPPGTAAFPWSSNRYVKLYEVGVVTLWVIALDCSVAAFVTSGVPVQRAVTSVFTIGAVGDVPTVLRNPVGKDGDAALRHHWYFPKPTVLAPNPPEAVKAGMPLAPLSP
jgi:hypothetical protein